MTAVPDNLHVVVTATSVISVPPWCISTMLVVLALATACAPTSNPTSCDGTAIEVDTTAHVLRLCEAGQRVGQYSVALGRHGVDKRSEGDGRTPLGRYDLGEPRPSPRFGTFVPVAYPTADQRARGLSGSNIGIHGPERRAAWLGGFSVGVDWTQGCVAVGSDADIAEISDFVRRHPSAAVKLTR